MKYQPKSIGVEKKHCLRCGYEWYPRVRPDGTIRVVVCPSCHNPYWNEDRSLYTTDKKDYVKLTPAYGKKDKK